jgi:hypothetical protein
VSDLQERFGRIDVTLKALENLIQLLADAISEKLGAFLSSGVDLAKGFANTVTAVHARVKTWTLEKGVQIRPDDPTAVVNAIKYSMDLSVGQGLYEFMKGAGNLALNFAVPVAGAVVAMVLAVLEMVVKLVWRLFELKGMQQVLEQAAGYWKQQGQPDSLHLRASDFADWFRESIQHRPALAVLTLNSGICFYKMVCLRMLSDERLATKSGLKEGQEAFDKGCDYVDYLKGWGAKYLQDCGFRFTSKDPVVDSYLTLAGSDSLKPVESMAWTFVAKCFSVFRPRHGRMGRA